MLLVPALALLPLLAPPDGDEDLVQVACFLEAESLQPGSEAGIILDLLLDGVSAGAAGAPAPFVQLDVPPSVKLLGRELVTHRELANNEFLQEPWERLLEQTPGRIPFRVVTAPKPGETIGVNVLAYVRPRGAEGDEDAFFLRRRLELPLELDAEAREVPPTTSDWGTDETLLQIGDRAPSFDLPRADGTRFSLDEVLGKKRVFVTTYRAHW